MAGRDKMVTLDMEQDYRVQESNRKQRVNWHNSFSVQLSKLNLFTKEFYTSKWDALC